MSARTSNSAEQPWPVRSVSTKVAGWIDRLGSIWVEGQLTQINVRPGTRTAFLVLRDPVADMSLQVTCSPELLTESAVALREGSRVVVFGKLVFFPARGSLSLRITEIRAVGLGELLARIERLRALLAAEGLFDPRLKRALPFLPGNRRVDHRPRQRGRTRRPRSRQSRWPAVRFEIRNTAVQGRPAVPQILAALADLDADPAVDVIILARGGGSVEDLLPFSDEAAVPRDRQGANADRVRDRARAGPPADRPRRRRARRDARPMPRNGWCPTRSPRRN